MPRHYYSGDPYWMTARYDGNCAGCGAPFKKGDSVFRYKSGAMYGSNCNGQGSGCGEYESERFNEAAYAEYAMCSSMDY